jgi:xanthine/uracil/vitamin C permease (AzgA family)
MLTFLVQLDPGIQNLFTLGVTFVVTFLLLKLAALYPPLADYIGQYKAGIITWVVGLLVQLSQNWLNQIPESWDTVAMLVMRLIVEVAAVLLAFAFLRKRGVRGLQ